MSFNPSGNAEQQVLLRSVFTRLYLLSIEVIKCIFDQHFTCDTFFQAPVCICLLKFVIFFRISQCYFLLF